MGHKNKVSLHQQVYDRLQGMNAFNCEHPRKKKEDKTLGLTSRYIYSRSTMTAYLKHCHYYIDWCINNADVIRRIGHKPKTLDECYPYVSEYIKSREDAGLSAYTIKLELSALAKLYQDENLAKNIDTVGTSRSAITRSRKDTVGDKNFSVKNNAEMINACRCIGFRRSELQKAKPEDLFQGKDGIWYIYITGKGGKHRTARLFGTPEEIERAVAYVRTLSGDNHIHSNADIHSYRADYAVRAYTAFAQPVSSLRGKSIDCTELTGKTARDGSHIIKSAVYYCKGDQAGMAFDRKAMIIASRYLGHNRESVIGEHYLYNVLPKI